MAHILLVEDDAEVVGYARNVLENKGYSLDVASDGETALVAYMTRRPDLILLDVFVPRIDGIRFARALAERFPGDRVPIVVWTGAYEPESIGDLLDTPYVLRKPVGSEELLEVVQRALGQETKARALRVLVVSPKVATLRALVDELRAEFDVHPASRWDEALVLVEVRPYEAVVVDVSSYGSGDADERDAVGILRALHARHRDTARVAVIGPEQEKLGRELKESGTAEVVLTRPWDKGALPSELHAIVG
ncbi:MAG: response regulator [Myxococcales bacterium]|nr:response regulator [Myxococcales bacterium]